MAQRSTKKPTTKKRARAPTRTARHSARPSKQYLNPPITEAVCEFHFEPSQAWDATFAGLIYPKLRRRFPKRQSGVHYKATVGPGSEAVSQKLEQVPQVRFLTNDETIGVRLRVNELAVSHFRPYTGWHKFLPLIEKSFEAYSSIVKPKSISRIGLRYINKFQFTEKVFDLEDYFNFYPYIVSTKLQTYLDFICGIVVPFDEAKDGLRIQTGREQLEEDQGVNVILDLDYFRSQNIQATFKRSSNWLKKAHDRIEEAFEGCITDSTRERID